MKVQRPNKNHLLLFVAFVTAAEQPGTQKACMIGTGDPRMPCTRLDIICDTANSIRIVNLICGIRQDVEFGCIPHSNHCKIDCCRNASRDIPEQMHDLFINKLSRNCENHRDCHVDAPIQPEPQSESTVHFCLVEYTCVSVSVPATFAASRQEFSEMLTILDMPQTTKVHVSESTENKTTSPSSVLLTAVTVSVSLIIVAAGTGMAVWRRRRLIKRLTPDIKIDAAKNSLEHRISNTYESIQSPGPASSDSVFEVNGRYNNDLSACCKGTLNITKNSHNNNYITFDQEIPHVSEEASNDYHIIEEKDTYNVIDPEQVSSTDITKHTGGTESHSDYYALDFKSDMARHGQENYYAAMTHQSVTKVQKGEDDKDFSFDADDNPYHILEPAYHILDPHDPNTVTAKMQTKQESLERSNEPKTPETVKDVSPDVDINPYHILEPLEADTISDAKHLPEEMLGVTVETSTSDDDYNKINFKINNVRNDVRFVTMETIQADDVVDRFERFIDNAGEYSHLGGTDILLSKRTCDPDNQYSPIDCTEEESSSTL